MRTRPLDIREGATVQADGGYFCGKRRSINKHGAVHNRKEREQAVREKIEGAPSGRQRRARQMSATGKANIARRKKRRVVAVIRELFPEKGRGARRTVVDVFLSENSRDMTDLVRTFVPKGSTIMTDECPAYLDLSRDYDHRFVAHSAEWVNEEGTNDNQAESYFSRLRRAEYGVYHQFTPLHLLEYAQEHAWREDCRRMTLKDKTFGVLQAMLTLGKSIIYRGYWQGNRLKKETIALFRRAEYQ